MTQHIKEHPLHTCALNAILGTTDDQAYVRSEIVNHENLWAIYDATGEKLGHASSREMAFAVAHQNDLAPVSVH